VTHQLGAVFASMRSASSGIVASEIGDSSGRKQNAPNSQSMVWNSTPGVNSISNELNGWVTTCHAACGTLLPSAL
jgi:hypothetical protein